MFEIDESVQAEIAKSTDRACAIIGGAYVEQKLFDCLRQYFVRDADALEAARTRGMLKDFAMKIDAAYLTGFISAEFRDDLHIIRRVRNRFAHDLAEASFREQQIADWVSNIKKVNVGTMLITHVEKSKPEARRQFESAIGEAGGILTRRFWTEHKPYH